MPSAYTSLLGLIQPVTGSLTNTWGTAVNNQLTQLIEDSIAQYSTADVTSGNWTLTTTAGGVPNQARNAILIATGAPATTRYIYAPKQSKTYVVINNTSDGSNIYVSGGPTSPTTGVIVAAGSSALVAWDSDVSDFVKVAGGGGGATGGGNDTIFFNNGQTVTTNYTIPASTNSGTYGPIAVNAGVVVTVPDDSTWTVV
jgi:hypothetical protein